MVCVLCTACGPPPPAAPPPPPNPHPPHPRRPRARAHAHTNTHTHTLGPAHAVHGRRRGSGHGRWLTQKGAHYFRCREREELGERELRRARTGRGVWGWAGTAHEAQGLSWLP